MVTDNGRDRQWRGPPCYNRPMMRTLALLAVLAAPARAASLEAAHAAAGAAVPVPAMAFKAQRHVLLNGHAQLSGSGFIQEHGGFVSVPLNGSVRVSGDAGQVSGDGFLNQYVSLWVHPGSNYVSQFVSFTANVSLYRQGRYVGMATVSGSVMVSGWANGSFLRLDGTGSASGSAFINDGS